MRLQLITTAFALYPHSSKNLERGRFPTTFAQEVVSPTIKKAPTSALNMGMGKAAAEVVLKDFSKDAASWFGGVRTPASFIMGSSLGALFTMTGKLKGENSDKLSTPEYILVQMYQVLILGAFVLSLSTVVFATAANVQVMYGDFNPMATNGYSLLKREFEFPFVTARLGFLGSLILFITSVFIRALLEYDILTRGKNELFIGLGFILVALVSHLLSYINGTLVCWPNLAMMFLDWVKLVYARAVGGQHNLQSVSVISTILGLSFFFKHLLKGINIKLISKDSS